MTSSERFRERIASVDTAWLRMDRPSNLMQIVGVMIFAGRLDPERLKRTVAKRLQRGIHVRRRTLQHRAVSFQIPLAT